MHLSLLTLSLALAAVWSANGQQASSPYYGLPLGSIFYSSSATQGEVYVSESRKIIVVNFQHGGDPGCTSFMVGPPVQGANVSLTPNKEGVILAVQPRIPKRRRRQAPKSGEKPDKASRDGATVIQFGNPSASSSREKQAPPPTPQPRDTPQASRSGGGGISWGDQPTPQQPQQQQAVVRPVAASSNVGGGIRWGDSPAPSQPSGQQSSQDIIRLGGSEPPKRPPTKLRELPLEYIGGLNIPDEEEGKGNPNVTALLNDPFNPDRPAIPIQRAPTEAPPSTTDSRTIQFGGKRITPPPPGPATEEPAKTFRGLPLPPAGPSAPGLAAPGTQDATVVKLGGDGSASTNATADQTQGGNHTECGNGWCVVPDPRKRQPAPPQATNASTVASPQGTTEQPSNGSNQFVVVDDRKAQFLPPELLPKLKEPAQLIATNVPLQETSNNKAQTNSPVISEPREEPRYSPPALAEDGKTYFLNRFNGENVVLELPEPYEISEFQWFGIYDFCKRARTAFVNVRGIQAPKEVKIDGLRGWQYDVNSGDIFIKNCNTLQITNFTFSGAGKTEAFIYVGNGAFPHSIIQKGRAYIDGTFPDRSLKNFNNEDVLVKLPSGWKTFDITWIAIFNPKGNVSYGHVLVPSLVVPACEEPK